MLLRIALVLESFKVSDLKLLKRLAKVLGKDGGEGVLHVLTKRLSFELVAVISSLELLRD